MRSKFSFILCCMAIISSASATEIIAHRGSSATAPENTLAAFKLAWEQGADACENDVYLTADGKIAVLHDRNTKRTTGIDKAVDKATMAELSTMDAGAWKNAKWKGEKIPTLEESLATLPVGAKRFFIEVKCGPEIVPALTAILQPMQPRAAQLCVISFNRAAAAQTKKAMPWLKVYLLASGKKDGKPREDLPQLIQAAKEDQLDGLNLGADWDWNEAMVKQVRDAKLGLYAWTIDKPEVAKKLAKLGIDGITTNDPPLIRSALEQAK